MRSPHGKLLFLKRAQHGDFPETWCFPGGGMEQGEDARATALRETREETGYDAAGLILPLDERDGFTTFHKDVDDEFTPQLNGEHTEFQWALPHDAPTPLHPGVAATLKDRADSYQTDLHKLSAANSRAGVSEDSMQHTDNGPHIGFNGLVKKLEARHYSKEVATKIAGKVAAEKGDDCAMSEDSFDALCKDLEAKGYPKAETDASHSSAAMDAACAAIVHAWNDKARSNTRDAVYTRDFAGYYAPTKLGKTRRMTPEGYLLCQGVPLARTGEQLYKEDEFLDKETGEPQLKGDQAGFIRVHRKPEEVFHPDTMASFEGKPVTVEHPNEFVTPDTHNKLSVGHVQNVRRGEGIEDDLLLGDVLITSADAIRYVNKYLPEVSAGYDADYEQNEPGEAFQRKIRANHAALVERGRAGPRVSIKDSLRSLFMSNKQTLVQKIVNTLMARGVKATDAAACAEDIAKDTPEATHEDALDKRIADAIDRKFKARDEEEAARKRGEAEGGRKSNEELERERHDKEEKDRKAAEDAAKREAEDAERVGDTIIEAESPGKVINLGKVYTGDSASRVDGYSDMVSRAEILAPGVRVPTRDSLKGNHGRVAAQFLRDSIEACRTRDAAGADCVGAFLMGRQVKDLAGSELLGVFNGASSYMRMRNNAGGASKTSARTGDFSVPSTIAEINAANRKFWAAKK